MNLRITLPLVCALSTTGCFITPDAPIGIDAGLVYSSSHVRRGMTQVESGVLRPELRLSLPVEGGSTLAIDARGVINTEGDTGDAWLPSGHGGEFSELDLGVMWLTTFGFIDFATGLVSYNLPNGTQFTRSSERGGSNEVFVSASTDVGFGIVPRVGVHYDYDEVDGFYFIGELNRAFELDEEARWTAVLLASAGYSDGDHSWWAYGLRSKSIDLKGAGTLEFAWDDNTRFFLTAAYSTIADTKMEDWFDAILIDSNVAWIELGVAWGM